MARHKEDGLDELDFSILRILAKDARAAFLDIAKQLNIAAGTVTLRYQKLQRLGVVKGSRLNLDTLALGFSISAFIGVNLIRAKDYKKVVPRLARMPEVVEAHYTTGQYTLICRVMVADIHELQGFLVQIQDMDEIQGTETMVIFDSPIIKDEESIVAAAKQRILK